MKSEWKRVRIADVADVRRGASPRPIHNFLSDEGMPWVKIADATSKNSRYIAKTKEFIKESGVSASVVVVPETLILSNSATPGLPRIMKIQACVHDGWLVFGNYRNVERDFLYYLLTYVRPNLIGLANGSVFQNLKTDIVNRFEISLPPLSYQRKVAAILSSLDDKIENNSAICKNLEEQAAALYKSWFVDFEPFGGQLPKSWRERDIYSIAEVIYGAPFSSKLFNSEKRGVPILRIRDLKKQDSDVYTDEVHPKAYVISPGDIVVGMDGEFQPHIWGGVEGLLNQRVCVFRNMHPKGSFFLYFTILPQLNFIEKTEMATTVIHIGKKDFDAFRVLVPTDDVLEKFDALSDPMYKEIVSLRQENRRLFSLRDTLLPKLMSGEIDVDKVAI